MREGGRPETGPGDKAGEHGSHFVLSTVVWVVLGVIWGATWLFIKVGLEDLPPVSFAGIRFALAAVPLWVWVVIRRPQGLKYGRDWAFTAVSGLLSFSVSYGLVFWGEQHVSSGLTAILFTSYCLFGLLFAHLLVPGEPLVRRKLAGVLLGICGIVAIFMDQIGWRGGMAMWGSLAIVLAAAVSAISTVMVKRMAGHLDPVVVTAWQMTFGAVPLVALGLLVDGNPLAFKWSAGAALSLAYLAFVGSSLAFVLWYWLLKRVEVTKAQTMPLLNTLVAVLLGWVVLGEGLGLREAAGGAAILVGTALVLTAPRAQGLPSD